MSIPCSLIDAANATLLILPDSPKRATALGCMIVGFASTKIPAEFKKIEPPELSGFDRSPAAPSVSTRDPYACDTKSITRDKFPPSGHGPLQIVHRCRSRSEI